MRKVMHKVKSQWVVMGVMGATIVALGTVDMHQVSADEHAPDLENVIDDTVVELPEEIDHDGADNGVLLTNMDEIATEETIIAIEQEEPSVAEELSVATIPEPEVEEEAIISKEQEVFLVAEETTDVVAAEPQMTASSTVSEAPMQMKAMLTREAVKYVQIVATTDVNYDVIITRGTDGINTKPWGTEGFSTIGTSADYLNAVVSVSQEQVTDNGVTWALISKNGTEIGWISKEALTVQEDSYAKVLSITDVDYHTPIVRSTDAINTQPWGAKGWETVDYTATYQWKTVSVSQERVMDSGVTWALISYNGQQLGWVVKNAFYAQIISEQEVAYPAVVARGTDGINTQPWGVRGWQTVGTTSQLLGKEVSVSREKVTDSGVTWALISHSGQEVGWVTKDALNVQSYAQIIADKAVSYPATIIRGTDAINAAPWGTKGFWNIGTSADHVGKTVDVSREQVTDYGVTWAHITLNGQELGWITKDALMVENYAQIITDKAVSYPAIISRGTDAINAAPWGTRGYWSLDSSAHHVGKIVDVRQEQLTDYGVTWALISVDGQELGWIAKDALTIQSYAQIVSETIGYYPAMISRGTDAINAAPWGTRGYKNLDNSAKYVGKTVDVNKEQVTDYGVTWAHITLDGEELGWIAKDALTVKSYAQIVSETIGYYPAAIRRGTDAINSAPWGTKGYQNLGTSAAYVGKIVDVNKEQVTDYGVTWVHITLDGKELGWIAKDALTIQTYAQIVSEIVGYYPAVIRRDTDAINSAPWGTKGYQNLGTSAAHVGKVVDVNKEQVTDYGVTWAHITLDGEDLGWIAKDALTVQSYAQIVSETVVDYSATISRGTDAINTAPWGARGYHNVGTSAAYVGEIVNINKEQVMDYGVTWAHIMLDGEDLGWVAKDALTVLKRTFGTVVETQNIRYFNTLEQEDNTIPFGERVLAQVGSNGYDTVTYEVVYVDGIEMKRVEVSRVITDPTQEVIKLGTQVTEVHTETRQENGVGFVTIEEFDHTMLVGERTTVQSGTDGYDTVVYQVTYVNGIESSRVEISRHTTTPRNKIVRVGTKEWIASLGGFVIESLETDDSTLYEGDWNYKEITMKVYSESNPISSVQLDYRGPSGVYRQVSFSKIANNTFSAFVPTFTDIAGNYGMESITLYDVYGNIWTVFSRDKSYGSGYSYTSADLSSGDFTVYPKPVITTETLTETIPFETIYQDDPTLVVGETQVIQTGVTGTRTHYYSVTHTNGIETDRYWTGSEITRSAVNETIAVGTAIAKSGGFTIQSLSAGTGGYYYRTITMVATDAYSWLSQATKGHITYRMPNGYYKQANFSALGNNVLEASLFTPYSDTGLWEVDSIYLEDMYGNWKMFSSQYHNLSSGNFVN